MAQQAQPIKYVKGLDELLIEDPSIDTPDGKKTYLGGSGKKYRSAGSQTYKTSIADIRASSDLNLNIAYLTYDFGEEGKWIIDSGDTTSVDNTGTVLVNQSGQRFKRQYEGPVKSIWFGIVGNGSNNNTDALKSLIEDYGFPYIRIGKGYYMVEGTVSGNRNFVVPSNTRIELDDEAVIEVIPGEDGYRVFALNGVENVIIDGGAVIGDRDEHTGAVLGSSLIDIRSQCKNIVVRNMKLRDSWTDGIYIGGGASTPENPLNCENVWVDNVQVTNCYRNGMSITNAKSVKVANSIFENSNGTNPQSGIDLEPNENNIVEDIQFTGCTFRGNANQGIMSTGNNATFINCNSYDNGQRGAWIAEPNHAIIGGAFYNNTETNIYVSGTKDVIIKGVLSHSAGINGIDIHQSQGAVQVEGCISRDNVGIGILASAQDGYTLDKCVFSNNIVYDNGTVGLNLDCADSSILGNVITGNGSYGMNLLGDGNMVSANSVLKCAFSGVRLQGSKNILSDNYIRSSSQAANNTYDNILVLSGASGNIIRDNTLYPGEETSKPRFAVRINDSSCSNNMIVHCSIDSTGQNGDFSDLGTGTIIIPLEQVDPEPVEITGTDIDFRVNGARFKNITSDLTLTTSSHVAGKPIDVAIRNDDGNPHTVTVTGAPFPKGSDNEIPAGGKAHISLQQIDGEIDASIVVYDAPTT